MFEVLENNIKRLANIYLNTYNLNALNIVNDNNLIFQYNQDLKKDQLFNSNYKTLKKDVETLNYLFKFTIHNNIDYNCTVLCQYNINHKQTTEIIKIIYLIVNILSSLYFYKIQNLKLKETNIIFYLYDKPRTLENKDLEDKSIFGLTKANRFNCTCGYTTYQKDKILITRLNRFSGLLVHELLHFFDVDQKETKIEDDWPNIFKNYINNQTKSGYFFEGINNFKACIINMLIKRHINEQIKNESFIKLFEIEYSFAYYTCLKLMEFFKCRTFKELKRKFKHEGSMFEYVFIKFILMSNIDYFKDNIEIEFKASEKEIKKQLEYFEIPLDKYNKLKSLFHHEFHNDNDIDYYFF